MDFKNKILVTVLRSILGLYLVFAAVNGFFQLLPPPQLNEAANAFMTALFNTNYMLPLMSLVFLVVGLLFLFNRWSAFGAVLLAPITVNIILFHVFLDFTGWWMALIFALLHIYLALVYWSQYKPLFSQ